MEVNKMEKEKLFEKILKIHIKDICNGGSSIIFDEEKIRKKYGGD